MTRKIEIQGNGGQAPYGIGEIIEVIPAAHFRKIAAIVQEYYNPPTLRCSECGSIVELDWSYNSRNGKELLVGITDCNCQ